MFGLNPGEDPGKEKREKTNIIMAGKFKEMFFMGNLYRAGAPKIRIAMTISKLGRTYCGSDDFLLLIK